jgi:hypothetical protein
VRGISAARVEWNTTPAAWGEPVYGECVHR